MPDTQELIDALQVVHDIAAEELANSSQDGNEAELQKQGSAVALVAAHIAKLKRWREPKGDPVIRAEAHDDSFGVEVDFDAEPWFKMASNDEIRNLAKGDWGNCLAADRVVDALEDSNEDLKRLFWFIGIQREKGNEDTGFECDVDEEDALKWLAANRPELHKELLAVEEGDDE